MADVTSLERKIRERGKFLTEQARNNVFAQTLNDSPRKTGELRRSGKMLPVRRLGNTYETGIVFEAPQAKWTDEGTRGPYTIVPRRARVLRFRSGGTIIFRKRVRHPGIRAQRWFRRPMAQRWRTALRQAVTR